MLICQVTIGAQAPVEIGYIGCPFIAALAPYTFARADDPAWTELVTIVDYARWAESAFALLARMLVRLPPQEQRWPFAANFSCRLLLGRSASLSRQIEQLFVAVERSQLRVELRDEVYEHVVTAPVRPTYDGLADVLVHAARVAVWGVDAEPALPLPLTSIPARRTADGLAYVLEQDIPEHPRRHFQARQQFIKNSALPPGAHRVTDWLRFVGV